MTNTLSPRILARRAQCLHLGTGRPWSGAARDARVTYPITYGVGTVGRVEHDGSDGRAFVYRVGHPTPIVTVTGTPAEALDAARDLIAPHLI